MIPSSFELLLEDIFNTVGLSRNEGAQLSVDEWDVDDTENIPQTTTTASYLNYRFDVNAIFQSGVFKQLILDDPTFLNLIKDVFVVEETQFEKIEQERIKLTLTLVQAKSTC